MILTSKNKKNYIVLLCNNNFENDFEIAIADTKIKANQLYSRYIYSNIDNEKQNLKLQLLSTIDNIILEKISI